MERGVLMRPIGFSTGALAKSDVREGLAIQAVHPRIAVTELSALRDWELRPLVDSIPTLDLRQFGYVSIHAPSKLGAMAEEEVVDLLHATPQGMPIIVHPEVARTPSLWVGFGRRLCLENMDNRKRSGRTVDELRALFEIFPEAGFCLDIGHARQIDPTMAGAMQMLRAFRERLVQLHVSEVGASGEHLPLSSLAMYSFQVLANLIPESCPLIIESVVPAAEVGSEIAKCEAIFGTAPAPRRRSMIELAATMVAS